VAGELAELETTGTEAEPDTAGTETETEADGKPMTGVLTFML